MVVVEDLEDLGLIDPDRALGLLGMIDQHDLAARWSHEVRARDQPHRTLVAVDRDRGAVVALLDLLGDVVEQEVGRHRQRIGLHQGAARRRERDHASGDIAVQARADDRGASGAGALEHLVARDAGVGDDHQRGSELDHQQLRLGSVPDHDHVAVGDPARGVDVDRVHPHAPRQLPVLATQQLAVEHLDDRRHVRRRVLERRGVA